MIYGTLLQGEHIVLRPMAGSDLSDRVDLAIETAAEGVIGDLELADIDYDAGTAELRICIDAEDCRGKGYGTEAVTLAADYAFTSLQLAAVYLRVALANWPAIRCYHKCGFAAEGILVSKSRRSDSTPVALMVLKKDH